VRILASTAPEHTRVEPVQRARNGKVISARQHLRANNVPQWVWMERNGLNVARKLIAKCKCKNKSFSMEVLDDEQLSSNEVFKMFYRKSMQPVFHFKWDCCGLKVIVNGRLGSVLS
jgi:hypothetical protein